MRIVDDDDLGLLLELAESVRALSSDALRKGALRYPGEILEDIERSRVVERLRGEAQDR